MSTTDLAERASELGARIALAVAVTVGFVLVGRLLAPLVRRILDRRGRPSYTRVFAGLFRVAIALVGVLASLTLAFPSVRVADVLAIFGILSVAAGFAFKDTFENLLAGVLLMLRDPFQSGDQVTVAGTTGTVEGVTVRETLLRGHDGRRYFVPNAKVMTDVIDVETDRPAVRQVFSLQFDRTCDLHGVRASITGALSTADGVLADPAPDAVITDVIDGDPVLTCRFWAGSTRAASGAGDAGGCVRQHREALLRNRRSATLAAAVLTGLGTLERRLGSSDDGASLCHRLGGCVAVLLDRVVIRQHLLVLGRDPGEVVLGRHEVGPEAVDVGLIVS